MSNYGQNDPKDPSAPPQYGQQDPYAQQPPQYGQQQPQYGQQDPNAQQPPQYGQQDPNASGQYGAAPQFGAAPHFADASAPEAAQPASIARAVLLMRIGAVLSLLNAIVPFAMKSQIRDAVERASAKQSTPMTSHQIDVSVNAALAIAVFSGLVGVALWLWMASANGKGRGWARIVATVFFGLAVVGLLGSLVQPGVTLSRLLQLVLVVLGAWIIVLLYRRESSAFYQSRSHSRR